MDQPGKVANPARDQLNREKEYFPVPVRAGEIGRARRVRQSRPASVCSSPYSRLNLVLTRRIPPAFRGGAHLIIPISAIGSVPRLSVHAIAYRWRSLPRVRRHGASKPQGGSERVLPWLLTVVCRFTHSAFSPRKWRNSGDTTSR